MKKFCCFIVFYVNTFILLHFLRWQEGGGYSPPSHPPKSATDLGVTIDEHLSFNEHINRISHKANSIKAGI